MDKKQNCPKCGRDSLHIVNKWVIDPNDERIYIFTTLYMCEDERCNLRLGYGNRIDRSEI